MLTLRCNRKVRRACLVLRRAPAVPAPTAPGSDFRVAECRCGGVIDGAARPEQNAQKATCPWGTAEGDRMPTVKAKYLGQQRVEAVHTASSARLVTDAPVDNHGRGEAFSPTDLCATALATCAMTIMAMTAERHGMDLTGTTIDVVKKMLADPRRIGEIDVVFTIPDKGYSEKEKIIVQRAADSCPVKLSLHPDVKQNFAFNWVR